MIKAYLFSDITRQISHTYYSLHGTTIGPSKFFYNLKDYEVRKFSLLESFIYEVEIYPESVVGCFDDYIEARKYKIIRNVKFVEYLNETNLSDEIAEEFNAILNGNYLDLSLIVELRKLLKKKILNLTIYERFKFLVILNQAKIDIPLISLEENYQIYYIKLLEFYGVSYDCSKLNYHKSEIEEQKYFGNTEFEILNHQTGYIYDALFENRYYASNLIRARKITQAQFEVFCEGVRIGDYIPNLDSSGLVSGYKIPNKYLNICSLLFEKYGYTFVVSANPKDSVCDLEEEIKCISKYVGDYKEIFFVGISNGASIGAVQCGKIEKSWNTNNWES